MRAVSLGGTVAEIIDFPVDRERSMKAELRGLLDEKTGGSGGGGGTAPGGREQRRRRTRPEAEEQWMHVEVTGDRPQTFIVRGDLYINMGSGAEQQRWEKP